MSLTPGVYTIILNITGNPIAALGTNGVDLIESTTSISSISKWIITPIGDVPTNAYTIQNESTNAFVVPAIEGNKLTFDVRPFAWFITGDLKNATISETGPAGTVHWSPNYNSMWVNLSADPKSPTWTFTKVY